MHGPSAPSPHHWETPPALPRQTAALQAPGPQLHPLAPHATLGFLADHPSLEFSGKSPRSNPPQSLRLHCWFS